jgi:CheY-like chemotaxis protein
MVEQTSTPEGFEVIGFQDGPAALDAARRIAPALIIADYHLNNMTFSGFCKEVNKLDNLSETFLISLIDASDRPDETHLRSLGVKAFLKKPFQAEDLLDIIKSLQQKQESQAKGAGLKRRVWPPTAASTDAEDDDGPPADTAHSDEPENDTMELPLALLGTTPAVDPTASPSPSATPADPAGAVREPSTKDSMGELVNRAVERAVTTQVRALVQKELRERLEELLSKERLTTLVPSLLTQELPRVLRSELTSCEPVIRDTVSDVAGALIKERMDALVKEHSETGVRKHLSEAVREQLGSIDLVVTDAVRQAAAKQAPLIADDVVRSSAEHSVEAAVQRIVPELAEQHIKAELKRLTSAE